MTLQLSWLENSPYYDSRVIIYARKMFIRLATGSRPMLIFVYLKNGPFQASSSFIFVLSIHLIVGKCSINFCRRLDSNRGPLGLEVTALPTEPQPLPNICLSRLQQYREDRLLKRLITSSFFTRWNLSNRSKSNRIRRW